MAEKKTAKKPAAKKTDKPAEAKVEVEKAEEKREVATVVEPTAADATELAQKAMVSSREYGEKVRKETMAGNREKRDLAQKAQTLRAAT